MPLADSALLLLGHGSTLNADSSAPTYQHAEEIRRRDVFAEVHVAFWKEEPNFRQALRQTRCRCVYVVPNFISSGYFTEQVIPRELGLAGPVTRVGDQEILYCEPIGLHSAMTEVLLRRAREVVASSAERIAEPAGTACLFICGHGTSLNDNSTKIIYEQAEIIRARKIFGDCQPVLMEQRPFVKDWRTLTDRPDVIVVPFFISDGLHSYEDIPVLLGLTSNIREQAFTNPHREGDRRLWYANAIGTEPAMADLILAQVEQFQAEHAHLFSARKEAKDEPSPARTFPALDEWARAHHEWTIGQVVVRVRGSQHLLCHAADVSIDPERLREVDFAALRDFLRTDEEGQFRPLRAAPNLRRGWVLRAAGVREIHAALDYIYPAEIANWALWRSGNLPVTPWPETAERQTGRFRVVREIGEASTIEIVSRVCDPHCLKRRLWSPAAQAVEPRAYELPLLCPEACNYFVGKAREKVKGPGEE